MRSVVPILRTFSVLLLVLATACSKKNDDMACPAKSAEGTEQRLMENSTGIPADTGLDRPQGGNRDPLLNGTAGDASDGSISDDGDDEADNEGRNKRGRNN